MKILILLSTLVLISKASNTTQDDLWHKHGVVSDVIDDSPSRGVLTVNYENVSVELGQTVVQSDALNTPNVTFPQQPQKFYLVLMTDPDAPSRENNTFAQVQHWMVVNIPGKGEETSEGGIEGGETKVAYGPPGPPKGSGLHRYIFLVFEQPKKLEFDEETLGPDESTIYKRIRFSVRKFSKKYELGSPIYGNFFQTQFQEE